MACPRFVNELPLRGQAIRRIRKKFGFLPPELAWGKGGLPENRWICVHKTERVVLKFQVEEKFRMYNVRRPSIGSHDAQELMVVKVTMHAYEIIEGEEESGKIETGFTKLSNRGNALFWDYFGNRTLINFEQLEAATDGADHELGLRIEENPSENSTYEFFYTLAKSTDPEKVNVCHVAIRVVVSDGSYWLSKNDGHFHKETFDVPGPTDSIYYWKADLFAQSSEEHTWSMQLTDDAGKVLAPRPSLNPPLGTWLRLQEHAVDGGVQDRITVFRVDKDHLLSRPSS